MDINLLDINVLRAGVTTFSLLLFLGIVAWAWSRSRRAAFDEAAQLPFQDGETFDNPAGDRR